MKRTLFLIGLISFFLPTIVNGAEAIDSFSVGIEINSDHMIVAESILYDFGTDQRHGIFRDIPLTAKDGPNLKIDEASIVVDDGSGNSYPFSVSRNGSVLSLKIGDPDITVSGKKVYRIMYSVKNSIRYFQDYDEIYWNLTGNGWQVPINSVSGWVKFAVPVRDEDLRKSCYTGYSGDSGVDCTVTFGSIGESPAAFVSSNRPLNPGEGVTFAVGFPKGIVQEVPYDTSPDGGSLAENVAASIFLFIWSTIFFGGLGAAAWGIARAIKMKRSGGFIIPKELKGVPVVTQFDAPAGMLPIDAGHLASLSTEGNEIVSVILDLAIKGYLRIEYKVVPIPLFPDQKDYEFVKLKDLDIDHPSYKAVFNTLFVAKDKIALSKIQSTGIAIGLKSQIEEAEDEYLEGRGLIEKPEEKARVWRWVLFPLGIAIWGFVGYQLFGGWVSALVGAFIGGIMGLNADSYFKLKALPYRGSAKLTEAGRSAILHLLGFKKFLAATEKNRLEMMNAPHLEPEVFEKNLPYAIVFGVEKAWAKQFEGIHKDYAWIDGADPNPIVLAGMMTSMTNSFATSVTPHSYSGGSGGGGSSGGGSGGGGGGSW